ncbi:MAG: hypothetical protein P4L69_14510, partial [Desulfosporosinus sp.]|nr:hypothetical protein [Desulfosporosinus sp.]
MAERLLPITDIDSVSQNSGSYRNKDITPYAPAKQTMALPAESQPIIIQIPNDVENFDKSTLTLNYTVDAGAAYYSGYEDLLGMEAFSAITLTSSVGTYFVNITNPAIYAKVVPKIDQSHKTFLTNDDATGFHPPLAGSENQLAVPFTPPAGNSYNLASAATYKAVSYPQPRYVRSSAAAGVVNISRTIPLGQLTGTLFALKHDQCFNTIMNLTLYPATSVSNFGFTTMAAYTSGSSAAKTPYAGTVTLSNVVLNLAIQTDPKIRAGFLSMAQSGHLKYQVPFLTQMSTPISAGTNASANVNLSSAYGRKMKRLINVATLATPTLAGCVDISNYNGSKMNWYGTSLGG